MSYWLSNILSFQIFNMNSLLIPGLSCDLLGELESSLLEERYKSDLNVRVPNITSVSSKIEWWKCPTTHLEFFTPAEVAGDGDFYQQLQRHSWYYMEAKWEYDLARTMIRRCNGKRILEVGCGKGAFLRSLREIKGVETATGLELNQQAVGDACASGLDVCNRPLSELRASNEGFFDVVCSFQVLEHVTQPRQFLEDQLALLKAGGLLIFAVPNSGGFLKLDQLELLNLPPHHMSRWFPETCLVLQEVLDIRLVTLRFEPLADYHIEYYFQLMASKWLPRLPRSLIDRIIRKFIIPLNRITGFVKLIRGHTMLAAFVKQSR